ncbi:MAG: hypothetical protein JNL64_08205 [Blastocatellia bacterium]|jgi:hypothetical protein|nr:hypothetical protein [Blastocatellia bacterium]
MNIHWFDIVGTVGVATIVVTYILLQTGRVKSDQLGYSVLNAVGATLILISLYFEWNFPSVIVESFWLVISLYGIIRYLRRR